MPTAPCGPSQNALNALLRSQYQPPEETTNLADTQRHTNPREFLKAVRLLCVEVSAFFLPARRLAGWQLAAPSTGHRPTWPMLYADTIPSNSALGTDLAPLRPWPLQSTVQRSSGCLPPAPRWPRLPHVAQIRRTLSAPWGRSDSGGPRASGASRTATARSGGATSSHTSVDL